MNSDAIGRRYWREAHGSYALINYNQINSHRECVPSCTYTDRKCDIIM